MHPTLAQELTHPGVHQREAGLPLAPALKGLLGIAPLDRPAVALLELRLRVSGEVVDHVVIEVAPAQLAAKRVGARPARQPLLHLARRDAAEVQVGRQARGLVRAELVVVVDVVGDTVLHPAIEAHPSRCFTAGQRIGYLLLESEVGQLGHLPLADVQGPRPPEDFAARQPHPVAIERAEDRVRATLLGLDALDVIDDAQTRVGHELEPPEAVLALAREGTDVTGEVHLLGAGFPGELRDLLLGPSVANDQPPEG